MLRQCEPATPSVRARRIGAARNALAGLLARVKPDVILLLAALAWLAATAWVRPLALPDEGRYVGVAWEMLRSGNWAVPTLNGMPFFHKPPLFYWITAGSMAVFGPHEAAARLAPLFGATLAAASTFLFVRRWADPQSSRLVLVVLLTTPLFYMGAQFANHDMLVAGCICATILLAAHAVLAEEQGQASRTALASAFTFAALGVLAKGLIGAVLPALVMATWALLTRRPRALRWLAWPPGLALFSLVAAPWFVLMQWRYPGFFDYFFVHQQFDRFAKNGFNNSQAWWFYLAVVALLTLPWFVWIHRAVRREAWKETQHREVRALMWAWLVVILLFFSIPQSKLVGYIIPVLPPMAFLLGERVHAGIRQGSRSRFSLRGWVALAMAVCVCAVVLVKLHPRDSAKTIVSKLQARVGSDDRVMMLDGYAYDAPVYLRLTRPVLVVDAWADPDIVLHDNRRREFHDAAMFASAKARAMLIEPNDAVRAICQPGVTWIFGRPDSPKRNAWLSQAERVDASTDLSVWRWSERNGVAQAGGTCAP